MNYAQKLEELHQSIKNQGMSGFIVPRTDEYQGEYVPECAERLAWLTGFTGSAGVAVVLADKAAVMSDGRYTIQLEQEVDGDLYSRVNSQEVKLEEWIVENSIEGSVIGYDPKLHTAQQIEELHKAGVNLRAVGANLVDGIWQDQPAPPKGLVELFPEKYAGASAQEKIKNIQKALKKDDANAVVLTMSDSIAWALNIRGSDIPYIPVALSYAIIPVSGKVQWFIDTNKITDEVREALGGYVEFQVEEKLEEALGNLKGKVCYDPKRSSIWFKNKLKNVLERNDPCILPRSRKNKVEQEAMKQAHIRDGVALV